MTAIEQAIDLLKGHVSWLEYHQGQFDLSVPDELDQWGRFDDEINAVLNVIADLEHI